jgi:hypothetical protein
MEDGIEEFFTNIPHDTTAICNDFDFIDHSSALLYSIWYSGVIHLISGRPCLSRPSDSDTSIGPEEAPNTLAKEMQQRMADWLAARVVSFDPNHTKVWLQSTSVWARRLKFERKEDNWTDYS